MTNELTETASGEGQAIANLERYAAAARGAFAGNTERALRADTAIFAAWCGANGRTALPATPDTVAGFIDAMRDAAKKPATIRRYVSSIAHLHRAAELASPAGSNAVRLALRRMGREDGVAQRQADGLTRRLIDRLLHAGGTDLRDLRNHALLAVAYDTLCRRSELVALRYADLERGPHGDGTVLVRRSKTDQEGAGMTRYLAPDTLRLLLRWLDAAGVRDGALFRAVLKGGRVGGALDPGTVARLFKELRPPPVLPVLTTLVLAHRRRRGPATPSLGRYLHISRGEK